MYDQRSLRSGVGLISVHLLMVIKSRIKRILVFSEKIWSAMVSSAQRPLCSQFFRSTLSFLLRDIGSAKRQQKLSFRSEIHLESDGSDRNQSDPAESKCQFP